MKNKIDTFKKLQKHLVHSPIQLSFIRGGEDGRAGNNGRYLQNGSYERFKK